MTPCFNYLKISKTSLILFTYLLLLSSSESYSSREYGARSGAFADIEIGARATALGGAYSALAMDPTATYWNPAQLAFFNNNSISGTYSDLYSLNLIEDYYIAATHKLQKYGAGGIFIHHTGVKFEEQSDTYSEIQFGYSYSRCIKPDLSFGVNLKLLSVSSSIEANGDGDAQGFGVDASFFSRKQEKLRLSFVIRNLYSRLNWQTTDRIEHLPVNLVFGGCYNGFENFNIVMDIKTGEENSLSSISTMINECSLGLEWWNFTKILALRGGLTRKISSIERWTGSFGIGVSLSSFDLDYSYVIDNKALGNTHRFTVAIRY